MALIATILLAVSPCLYVLGVLARFISQSISDRDKIVGLELDPGQQIVLDDEVIDLQSVQYRGRQIYDSSKSSRYSTSAEIDVSKAVLPKDHVWAILESDPPNRENYQFSLTKTPAQTIPLGFDGNLPLSETRFERDFVVAEIRQIHFALTLPPLRTLSPRPVKVSIQSAKANISRGEPDDPARHSDVKGHVTFNFAALKIRPDDEVYLTSQLWNYQRISAASPIHEISESFWEGAKLWEMSLVVVYRKNPSRVTGTLKVMTAPSNE